MIKKNFNSKRGFTLAELLIVVAIIGILVAISIVIFSGKKEDAANKTDAYNANVIARAVKVYYLSNPDELQTFIDYCNIGTSNHCAQIIVQDDKMYVDSILEEPLNSSGILGERAKTQSVHYFDGFNCESTKSWDSYSIAFSTYNNGVEIKVLYKGRLNHTTIHAWGWYTTDTTEFSNMAKGRS